MAGSNELAGEQISSEGSQGADVHPGSQEGVLEKRQLSERAMAALRRTIESEIIPRLMLAHKTQAAFTHSFEHDYGENTRDVREFTQIVLHQDAAAAFAFVDARRMSGAGVEQLLLNLLAPTAKRLGVMWEEDFCTFTDVTIGLSRLQQVLRRLCPRSEDEAEHINLGRRAMLAAAPGDQHSFGVHIVEEFFRRAGWDVWSLSRAGSGDLVRIVKSEWFAVVGLSASSDVFLEDLKICVQNIRRESCNKALIVMVGGSMFERRPDLVAEVGADAMATDGRQAVVEAERLVKASQMRC